MESAKREKVLILVKTYPHRSSKYIETVCTAGIREDGSWIRLFPIPYRTYTSDQQYAKYQWLECTCNKARDPRPESYHVDIDIPFVLGDKLGTQESWENRRRAVLDRVKVYTRLEELRALVKRNKGSLALFHPSAVRLRCEKAKLDDGNGLLLSNDPIQLDLFHDQGWCSDFRYVEPVPYDFKYEITDSDGEKATHKILDWELGTLFYWEKQRLGTEEKAKESVIGKYGKDFLDTKKIDLFLYMGTMLQAQQRNWPNPWSIIGVAPFPRISTRPLDLGI